jgi:drug/metabolite transporter (DMT)-like permease
MRPVGREGGMNRIGAIAAIAAAIFAATAWGAWFPLSRAAVTTILSPLDIALLRFVVVGVALVPVLLRQGIAMGRFGLWGSLAVILLVGAPYSIVLAWGLIYAPAAHVAIFVPGAFPALTFLLGVLLLNDPVTPRRIVGLGLGILGVVLVGVETLRTQGWGQLEGYLAFLLCAVMWSTYTILTRTAQASPMHVTAIVNVGSALGLVPAWLIFGDGAIFHLPADQLLWQFTFQGLIIGFGSLFAFNYAVSRLGAASAATFGGLVPSIAALLAVPVLGEILKPLEVAGLIAVTLGIVLVTGADLPRLGQRRPA